MADPPPLRLALPPDIVFEGAAATPPPPPDAEITSTLRSPELFGIELHDDVSAELAGLAVAPPDSSPDLGHGNAVHSGAIHRVDDDPDDGDDDAFDTSSGRRVRPYTITGGRTAVTGPEIPLEAQVLTSHHQPVDPSRYRWETARLVGMLEVPMALVEVAARLEVPVGVARVLVSDLVAEGVLIVHLPPPSSSFTSLLEQVLDGVRKL